MSRRSINQFLNEDLLCLICEYLHPVELMVAEIVCKFWWTSTRRDQQLWERHCIGIWLDDELTMNIPNLENINIMNRIKQIPLIQLKRALIRVDLTRCVEKIDFQRTFLAKLLFGNRSASNSTALRAYYPEWAFKMGLFKATYFYGVKERCRTNQILLSELCSIDWEFKFKYHDDVDGQVNRMRSEFKPDFTLVSGLNGAIYNWQVCSAKPNLLQIGANLFTLSL